MSEPIVYKTVTGIDPSLSGTGVVNLKKSITGFGGQFLWDYTTITSAPQEGVSGRLRRYSQMATGVLEMIDESKPELVLIEGYSFGSKGCAVTQLAEYGGILRLRLMGEGFKVVEVPPSSLKKFVTGQGNANKIKVVAALVKRYGVEFENDNEYDAYGLARMGAAMCGWVTPTKAEAEVLKKLGKES